MGTSAEVRYSVIRQLILINSGNTTVQWLSMEVTDVLSLWGHFANLPFGVMEMPLCNSIHSFLCTITEFNKLSILIDFVYVVTR